VSSKARSSAFVPGVFFEYKRVPITVEVEEGIIECGIAEDRSSTRPKYQPLLRILVIFFRGN
jgi:hypothetical protein